MFRFLVMYNYKKLGDFKTYAEAKEFCERNGYKCDEDNMVAIVAY